MMAAAGELEVSPHELSMNSSPPSFRLRLLGSPRIEDRDGVQLGGRAAQRHRLALLALLALPPPRPMSREKLISYLWPESDADRGRNLLNVALYVIRKELGEAALRSDSEQVRLDTTLVGPDVVAFEAALRSGDPARAVELYAGPFLDGFFLPDAPEFERWAEAERGRLSGHFATALEALAGTAEATGDLVGAVAWWQARAAHDPYDSRVALRLITALERSGNRAGALQHASIHGRLLEEDLGVTPPVELHAAVDALREQPMSHTASLAPTASRDALATGANGIPADDVDADLEPSPADPLGGHAHEGDEPDRRHGRAAVAVRLTLVAAAVSGGAWFFVRDRPDTPKIFPSVSRGEATAPAGAPVAARSATLAVLPFANLSRDPEEQYFADGLTEDLIEVVARVQGVRVLGRMSVFALEGRHYDVHEIGRRLKADAILTGSVRREGDRVRVRAELVEAANGVQLWSHSYDREGTDIFAIQSDIALHIADALEAELTPAERALLARRPTASQEAYVLYLKGRYFWNQRTSGGFARAIDYFRRAIEADPRYARAYAGLAFAYEMQGFQGDVAPAEAGERTRAAAMKALELDGDLAEAHTALAGYLDVYAWDPQAAEREHLRAIELDPDYATAHQWYGNLLTAIGRLDEAVAEKRRGVELDPLSAPQNESLGSTLAAAGRYGEAVAALESAIELEPTYWRAQTSLGSIYEVTGRTPDAVRAHERAVELAPRSFTARAGLARALALAGRREDARKILLDLKAEADRTGRRDPVLSTVWLALGEVDPAIGWLESAYRQKHPALRFKLRLEPLFAPLRTDPRFLALLEETARPQQGP